MPTRWWIRWWMWWFFFTIYHSHTVYRLSFTAGWLAAIGQNLSFRSSISARPFFAWCDYGSWVYAMFRLLPFFFFFFFSFAVDVVVVVLVSLFETCFGFWFLCGVDVVVLFLLVFFFFFFFVVVVVVVVVVSFLLLFRLRLPLLLHLLLLLASSSQAINQPTNKHLQSRPLKRLVGLVVKASASRAEDPGFQSRFRRDVFGVKSYK